MRQETQKQLIYFVSGMWCSTCSRSVQEAALKVEGVKSANINYASKILLVESISPEHQEKVDQNVQTQIQNIGFGIRRQAPGWIQNFKEELEGETHKKLSWLLICLVWFFAMWSSMIAFASYGGGLSSSESFYMALASSAFGIPAIILGIIPYAVSGIKALRYSRLVTLDLFIFIGGLSAISISIYNLINLREITYADSGSMIVAILLLTKKVENTIVKKITSSILFQLHPVSDYVFVERKQAWIKAASHQIRKGDKVRILSGETIPFDGVLESEKCEVNNHLLTGEGKVVSMRRGDHLLGGSIAASDLEMEVINPQGSRRIDSWAESALIGNSKDSKYSAFLASLEKYLVYFAFSGALTIAGFHYIRGNSLAEIVESFFVGLLIFCPCLFASVIPLAKQMAHLALLRIGVLLSRSEALFEVNDIKNVFIDKTGTLEAVESRFEPFEHIPMIEHLLSDLAVRSSHPILRGLKPLADMNSIQTLEEVPGKGVSAVTREGQKLTVGRPSFFKSIGISLPQQFGALFPLVALNGVVVGQIVTKKVYDRKSKEFLRKIKVAFPDGKIEVLSGDPNPEAGQALLKDSFGIVYSGNLSPDEKAAKVSAKSIFIGDGLNDTLALAKAHVSFLIGHRILGFAPVDFQIEFPNVNLILAVINYSRKFKRIAIQTLAAAFLYNIIAVGLAINGNFSPLGAVLAMLTSFSVLLLSSLRLLKSPDVPL